MRKSSNKLNQLTFTRFLAAFSVLFYHSGRDVGPLQYLPFLTSGQTAVTYFFVLSGFVMAYVYSRPEKPFNIHEYWLARFSRVYPVYILSFILVSFYAASFIAKAQEDIVFANILLYQAWFPKYSQTLNMAAWSLSVEIFFYALMPFLVIWARKFTVKKIIWLTLGFWALSQLIHSVLFIAYPSRPNFLLAFFPPFHLNAFLIGFAGGIWFVNKPTPQVSSTPMKIFLLIFSIAIIWFGLYMRDVTHTFGKTFYLDAGLFAPFFLIIILTLALDTTLISKVFSLPWLVLLGEASYAIYILHVPLRWWLLKILENLSINLPVEIFLLIYIPFTIVLSVFCYKLIEVPARDWLRKNTDKLVGMFFDIVVIAITIKLVYVLRLGIYDTGFLRTQQFTIFFGTVIFFTLMLLFKVYSSYSLHGLGLSILMGIFILTGFVYYAWQKGWVEGFPRPILAMIPIFIFSIIYVSRVLPALLQARTQLKE